MYDGQVAHLRARRRCIAYDHRGQGQSPASATAYDMETLYADAAALIEKLGAAPCHFVGLSMGGSVRAAAGGAPPRAVALAGAD
jgi:pimeloyl-ACP methyl ester carboxylesterase